MRNQEPSVLARYALDVAQSFNQFYNKERIVIEDAQVRKARLRLTRLVSRTIARTMGLLGIQTPERM